MSLALFFPSSIIAAVASLFSRRKPCGEVAMRPKPNDKIERLEASLLNYDQVEMPVTHRFAPGVYFRELLMPAGTFVIGHEHKTSHLNIVLKGRASVFVDGVVKEISAPCVLVSNPGTRKMAYIHEDMSWATVHPTNETDLDKLEKLLIVKSNSYLNHVQEMTSLRRHIEERKEACLLLP